MSRLCPHCQTEIRSQAVFCSTCGSSLKGTQTMIIRDEQQEPRFIIEQPGEAERTVPLVKLPLVIGRGSASDIVIKHQVVSRQHARVEREGEAYWISDLQSTNGTLVNNHEITRHQLKDGDIIRIGDNQGNSVGLTFRKSVTPQHKSETIDLDERLDLLQKPLVVIGRDPSNEIHLNHPSVSRRHAEVKQVPEGHELRDLGSSNGTFVNGKRINTTVRLQERDVVQIGPFKLVYDHEGLTQHTLPGNYRLDAISLTRVVSIARGFSPKGLFGLNDSPTRKVILDDISLSVYPKEFVALVGGSGAGKSTLIKALSGFVPAEGQVLVNGENLYANFDAYRSILGYVPQDDILHNQLTVRAALTYSAELRLPDASAEEIKQRIDYVLSEVEMTKHQQKQVSDLSGGQRKRVSIAVELLAEPGLFFLDEPTSGLDPGLEKKLMYTMRRLADEGRTILLVTHATANINQCTQVAFLANGRLMYFGPPKEALTFFGASDFADIYTRLSQDFSQERKSLPSQLLPYYQQAKATHPHAPLGSELWAAHFKNSAQYKQYVTGRIRGTGALPPTQAKTQQEASDARSGQRVSTWQQFRILTRRYFELVRRDTTRLAILLLVMPIIGLLLLLTLPTEPEIRQNMLSEASLQTRSGIIKSEIAFKDNVEVDNEQLAGSFEVVTSAQRLLFMMALAVNLLGLFAAAYEIINERGIYSRERLVNLKIMPYLFSKIAVLALFALLQCLLLLIVIGFAVTYPSEGVFLPSVIEIYMTLFFASLAAITLGLLVSAALRSTDTVIYVVLLILFAQILFGGAIFELNGPTELLSYPTTTRWTLDALGSTVNMQALKAQGAICIEFEAPVTTDLPIPDPPCTKGQLKQIPDFNFNLDYSHTPAHLISRWLILLGFAAAFTTLSAVVQRRKDVV